jgi:hypothetical protein
VKKHESLFVLKRNRFPGIGEIVVKEHVEALAGDRVPFFQFIELPDDGGKIAA